MKEREKEILKIEESFKDILENDLINKNTLNNKMIIKDIKYVGNALCKDKINEKENSKELFIVEIEKIEIDENGRERRTELRKYYLDDKCIGADLGYNKVIYSDIFKNSEPDKLEAVNKLLEKVTEKDLDSNSLNELQNKELSEILSIYIGKKIQPKDVQKEIEEMDTKEIKELEKKEQEQEKDNDKNKLTEKQTEKVKINGIQKVDLNKLVDGKEILGKKLDLQEYDSLYIIYSDKAEEITKTNKINNTTYSLVGVSKDGEAKVLNDEFEMDKTVGNNASRQQTKIRANSTATRDNKDLSVYTRKSNGMSIGCENNQGNVDLFLYQKTVEENENVGIQIETSKTPVIPIKTRKIMNTNKGIYQKEKVQDEIEMHTEEGCELKDIKDFDGNKDTSTHQHLAKEELDKYVSDIFSYENVKETFTEKEVKDKLLRKIEDNKDKILVEKIVEGVKEEMSQDANNLIKEH